MKRKFVYLGILALLVVMAVMGALMTPSPVTATSPYVVGGELETPQQSGGSDVALLVGAVAAAAIAVGVFVAYKVGK